MKVNLEYLRDACNRMAETKIVPLPVYIVIIGDKKFMCPVSSLPEGLAPLPCEIIGAQFPVEASGTATNKAMLEIALCLKAFMFVWDAEEGYGGIGNLQDRLDAVVAQLQQ
jgi:hypothetical protein